MQGYTRLPISEIGRWLEWRKPNKSQTILLLGSRAGALYRSEPFYSYCQQYVGFPFATRPLFLSYRECYNVLLRNQLSERELHTLLQNSLNNTRALFNIADRYCAEIIKRGYFREIISTNVDDMVEQALLDAGLIEGKDFEVFIPGARSLSPQRELPYRVTKVFGDVLSRQYAISDRQTYLGRANLGQYLHGLLSGDVLAIGIDPLWDYEILPFLSAGPRSLWFVNEEEQLIFDQQMNALLSQSKTALAIHQSYDHNTFWPSLYHLLCSSDDIHKRFQYFWQNYSKMDFGTEAEVFLRTDDSLSSFSPTSEKKAIRIMYIYCDEDLPLMRKVWQHFHTLKNKDLVIEWHRGDLTPGEPVLLRQERELQQAQLVFVGVSAQFLASDYIGQALQAKRLCIEGRATLVPLRLRPIGNSPFSDFSGLPKDKTLSELNTKELEKVLSKITEDIDDLVLSLSKRK